MRRSSKLLIGTFALFLFLFVQGHTLYAFESHIIIEKTLKAKPGESLYVKGSGADVKISTWDKDEAYVRILGNRRAEEKMEFYVERKSDGIDVIVKKRDGDWFNWFGGMSLRIEVTIPDKYNADINTSGGDIDLASLQGVIKLNTSGGDVRVGDTNGPLSVRTSGGDIQLRSQTGNTNLSTSGGDIKVDMVKGDLEGRTSGGDVHVKVFDGSIDLSTSGGDITIDYSGYNHGIEASTSGGDIDLRVPADLKADVELHSSGGDVDVDFDNSRPSKISRTKYEADLNGGGEKIYCKTSGGGISLRQK